MRNKNVSNRWTRGKNVCVCARMCVCSDIFVSMSTRLCVRTYHGAHDVCFDASVKSIDTWRAISRSKSRNVRMSERRVRVGVRVFV